MRGLTDFLITVHVMKGLVGRGPALIGMALVAAAPAAALLVVVQELYPGGLAAFCKEMVTLHRF